MNLSAWPRRTGRGDPPPRGVVAEPPGFPGARFSGDDPEVLARFVGELPLPHPESGALRILALSGGGAGGAFGAGALAGLTRAGRRPAFNMVTGVSTGALIAPLAFLGPQWDDRLADAFAGDSAAELMALSGLRPGAGLYAGERLAQLVGRFVDKALLEAVADAHRQGRRLLIATANLDSQSICIWNLGAVASQGGEAALALFTDLLVASASLPGLFPPKLIAVEGGSRRYEEMHVDGGAVTPLFVVPEPLILRRAQGWSPQKVEVYALMNTTLEPTPKGTPLNAAAILVRSFELMLRSSYQNALRSVAAFCEVNGYVLNTAAIPAEFGGVSMLNFEEALMARMFDLGSSLAAEEKLWSSPLAAERCGG